MIQRIAAGLIGLVAALTLAGCGVARMVSSSIIVPCDSSYYHSAVWSPDGQHIAFVARDSMGDVVRVMNTDGTNVRQLKVHRNYISDLQWMADSHTLLFHDLDNKAYIITLDGIQTEIVLPSYVRNSLSISPDSLTLVFDADDTEATIYRTNIDGRESIQLTKGPDVIEGWSPDGTEITFIHDGLADGYVYTMRADGSDQRELARGTDPVRWSPDGQWLAFVSVQDKSIHIIRPDKSGEKTVRYLWDGYYFAWSPDSAHLVFLSPRPYLYLQIVDVAVKETKTLSFIHNAGHSEPAWSPDGSQIAFIGIDSTSTVTDINDIYVINSDGSGEKQLTDNPGRYNCFNWPL